MPTARIVCKIKCSAKLAAYLEADNIGAGNAHTFDMTSFRERDKTRKERDTRMATHRRGRIIEVKGVCRDTIEKRSALHSRLLPASPQACHAVLFSALPTGQQWRKRSDILACTSHNGLILGGDSHGHGISHCATTKRNVAFVKL
jgi:hypothetical protein